MSAAQAHRGPDGDGVWDDIAEDRPGHAAFAHRLLAVVDARGVRQPMVAGPSGRAKVMVYNGEVRYREHKAELQKAGYRFSTDSDTEVIHVLYQREREKHPPWLAAERVALQLDGQFAFAIWDQDAETLVLVRDHVGQKPLFYYPMPDGVLFASERHALLEHPLVKREIGVEQVRMMLANLDLGGTDIWKGLLSVPPRTVVTVDRAGSRVRRWWGLETRPLLDMLPASRRDLQASPSALLAGGGGHVSAAGRHLLDLLAETVGWQVDRGVPVGALLAGLDSSVATVLSVLAGRTRGRRVDSFVLRFPGHEAHPARVEVIQLSVDADYARLVADMWGTSHREVVCLEGAELADREWRRRLVRAYGVIGLGERGISQIWLCERVREHVKTVLSGQGADELLGGYTMFSDPDVLNGQGWPWQLFRGGSGYTDRLASLTPGLREALDFGNFRADTYRAAIAEVEPLPGESSRERRLREVTFLEIMYHLPFFLTNDDAMSMASGLEVQYPYCGRSVLEFGYNIPWAVKMAGGRPKGVLSQAAGRLLPRQVLEREKSGYPTTPDPAYLLETQRQGRDLASQRHHPVLECIDRRWLLAIAAKPVEHITLLERHALDFALELAELLDLYRPSISF